MPLKKIPIHRIGNRPHLFMGADRELVMFTGLLSGILVLTTLDVIAVVFGIVLWVAGLYFLRKLAKADPLMRAVYLRHRRYRSYYPARSTPFRINRT